MLEFLAKALTMGIVSVWLGQLLAGGIAEAIHFYYKRLAGKLRASTRARNKPLDVGPVGCNTFDQR